MILTGDKEQFDPEPLLETGLPAIIWGVDRWGKENYPIHCKGSQWLAWCKLGRWIPSHGDCFGDIEFALLHPSSKTNIKAFNHTWKGLLRDPHGEDPIPDDRSGGRRSRHPTQKPVALMEWCLKQLPIPEGGLIFDPYAGSASVGVAALRAGYRYLGVEIDPLFTEAARQRLSLIGLDMERGEGIPSPSD